MAEMSEELKNAIEEAKKEIKKEREKKYYEKNKEKILSRMKENREKDPEKFKKYKENNRERYREYWREHYYKNKDEINKGRYKRDARNPEKLRERQKKYHYKKIYGITFEEYETIYQLQKGKCCICSREMSKPGKESDSKEILCVDHCHTTGKVRGLLCGKCNTGLGFFGDNIEGVKKALVYLERFNEQETGNREA